MVEGEDVQTQKEESELLEAVGHVADGPGVARLSMAMRMEETDPNLMTHVNQLVGMDGGTMDEVQRPNAEDMKDARSTGKKRAEYRLALAESEIEILRRNKVELERKVARLEQKTRSNEVNLKAAKERIKKLDNWCKKLKRQAASSNVEGESYVGGWGGEEPQQGVIQLGDATSVKIEKSSRHHGNEMTFKVTVNFPRLPKTTLEEAGFNKEVEEFLKANEERAAKKAPAAMAGDADWMNLLSQWKNIRSEFAQPAESRTPSPRKSPRRDREFNLKPKVVSTVSKSTRAV